MMKGFTGCAFKHPLSSHLKIKNMAKQNGILPLKGKIGNLSFYKTSDGHLLREKGGVDAKRIATDPAFQRTRENGAEFGRAGKAAKLLKTALRAISQSASDRRVTSRLVKEMMRVIKSDSVSLRGERNATNGNIELLKGFEFNINAVLDTTLFAPFTSEIDRVTGSLSIDIPAFVPEKNVAIPERATHFQINSAGAELDFGGNVYVSANSGSAPLPWDNVATNPIVLSNAVTPNSTNPLFLLLGIEFFQEVNGKMYTLKNGGFNALSVIEVSAQ
jgi:hypothetical protein